MQRIYSWNVNGIRAAEKKGLLDWFRREEPDVLCLQETKAHPEQLKDSLLTPAGYRTLWSSAEKKGYSGVSIFYKQEPEDTGFLGTPEFDSEGRFLCIRYPKLTIMNAYFPNSQPEGARLGYKLDFCAAILDFCRSEVDRGRNILLCGDYNIAHTPDDLARPKQNEKNPGYLPEERQWMGEFLDAGFTDTFRIFTKGKGHYTWWSYRMQARAKNIGWRLDYGCVNRKARELVQESAILDQITGSDHCPIRITLEEK